MLKDLISMGSIFLHELFLRNLYFNTLCKNLVLVFQSGELALSLYVFDFLLKTDASINGNKLWTRIKSFRLNLVLKTTTLFHCSSERRYSAFCKAILNFPSLQQLFRILLFNKFIATFVQTNCSQILACI